MADTDLSAMSVDELNEELTIQKVILDSLEDQTYDEVEGMREDAQRQINRIKKLLHARKQKKSLTPRSNFASQEYRQPRDHRDHRAMFTPSRHNNSLDQVGSFSLPNRKRRVDSARLSTHDGQYKTRRVSPFSPGDPFANAPAYGSTGPDEIDFIDLTGDDGDLGSDFIAEQLKAEKRQQQEKEDLEFARMLSSQGSPFRDQPTMSPHTNAFTRLMSSQPAGVSSLPDDEDWDTAPGLSNANPVPNASLRIPGAYDTSWDDMFGPGPASAAHTANSPAGGYGVHNASSFGPFHAPYGGVGNGPAIKDDPELIFAGAVGVAEAARRGQPVQGPNTVQPNMDRYPHHSNAYVPGMPPHHGFLPSSSLVPTMPGPSLGRGSTLSDIITKTSMFDYSAGTDLYGNKLPEHLTDLLQDAYHDPRITEKDLDNLLQNIRPDMDIPERSRDGTPAGLKRPLYPHQELALTWMKKKEEGTNKGGILADDMGLGKTISALALLLARPATTRPKTNLIVGPVALIRQWEEEINSKTKLSHRLSVFVYHNRKTTTDELLKYDVVLTTYGTIAQELKRLDKYIEDNADRNIDYNDRAFLTKCPLLHPTKARFYRVILDEAQCIKNKDTRTAKACTRLRATYRWCLTGTPMMNGVLELYSLLNFLRIKPYCKWDEFRQAFGVLFGRNGDPKSVAMDRLRVLLTATMLRRKKNSKLNDKPILKLPEKTEEIVYAELSSEERDFYAQLEKNAQVQFNKYLRAGSVGKNYSNILVLLLRMRQACCHPHLNLDVDDVAPTSISDEQKLELVKSLDTAIVERIKALDGFECPICYDVVQCPSFFIPCGHDSCSECLVRLTENASTLNLQEGNESNRAKCPVCRGEFDPSKCFSYEIFQKVHMPECVKEEPEKDDQADDSDDVDDDDDESESDYSSDDEIDNKGNLKGFIVNDELSDEEDNRRKNKKKSKGKGKKKVPDIKPSMLKTLRKEACKNRDAYKRYMRYLRKTWEPAAKVTECMKLLKEIHESGEKTIIFSQWTLLLDLLEVAMHHEKMAQPQRYDGSMSATQRNISARNFRDNKDVKVMLVSLRAGNAGLNLTAASRVIIMDPFWNPYIEMQAVDRAYRIGQQKEVKVYRILSKDTVEDRIVDLQNKKREIVEAALDENESGKLSRLGVNQLKFLFNTH
ncbi:dna repair rad16 [Fusarium albosuccineum]|uniref:Dna repair rad16 n=1 Tax=Fusarium albosuccineum TaxID=1237068 RepID=A0A8H4P698_9HYPO|nr:dna repair rad16 [Fusarium albosuccineum]